MLEEIGHDGVGIRAALEVEHQADIRRGFILNICEQRELVRFDEIGDCLAQFLLVDLIGDVRDDDARLLAFLLDFVFALDFDGATAGLVNLFDIVVRGEDTAASGEIGARNELAKRLQRDIGVIYHRDASVDGLA